MHNKLRIINIVFMSIFACTVMASGLYTGLGYMGMLFNVETSAPADIVFLTYPILWLPILLGVGIVWAIVYFAVRKHEPKDAQPSGRGSKDAIVCTAVFIALSAVLLAVCIIQTVTASNTITANTALTNISDHWVVGSIVPYAASIILLGIVWAIVFFKSRKSAHNNPPELSAHSDRAVESESTNADISPETTVSLA